MNKRRVKSKTRFVKVLRMQGFLKSLFSEIRENLLFAETMLEDNCDFITLNMYNSGHYSNILEASYYCHLSTKYLYRVYDFKLENEQGFVPIKNLALLDGMFRILHDNASNIELRTKWIYDNQERERTKVDIIYHQIVPRIAKACDISREVMKYLDYTGIVHQDDAELVSVYKQTRAFENKIKLIKKEVERETMYAKERIREQLQEVANELRKEFGDAVTPVDQVMKVLV